MKLPTLRKVAGGVLLSTAIWASFPCTIAQAQEEPAPSDTKIRADKLNEEGTAAYSARDYRKANEKFQQAYTLDPDPNILYNIAKTYELLGDDAAALEKFEAFVNQPGADPSGKSKAEAKISEIKARLNQKKVAPAKEPPVGRVTPAAPTPAASSSSHLPVWIALGVGVVGVGVGTVFGVQALGKRSDLDRSCPAKSCPPQSRDDIDSLNTASTISTIGFIAGGAGLVTAGILWLATGASKERTAASSKVTPVIGLTSLGLRGTF